MSAKDECNQEMDPLLLGQHNRLVENLREGILVIDTDETIINVNPAAAGIWNLECTELLGHSIREFVRVDHWQAVIAQARRLPPGDTLHCELPVINTSVDLNPISLAMIPAYNRGRQYIGCLLLIYGINTPNFDLPLDTNEKQNDDQLVSEQIASLRESESRYRLLASMSSDYSASIRVDGEGKFITEWVSGSFEEMTGFPAQFNQPATLELTHPDDSERQKRDIARTLQNEHTTTEFRSLRPTGGEVWLRVSRKPIWDEQLNRVTRILIVAKNITESKLAAQALEDSETRYKLLSSMTSDYAASVHVDPDGTLVTEWAVGSFEEITGHAIKLGKEAALDSTHPDDIAQQRDDIRKTIQQNVPTVTEFRSVRPNGEPIWLRVSRKPIWDDKEERVTRFLAVAQDITERKHAEEELRKSQTQQAELEGIQKTVATLAHEINNPLTGIIATLQMAPEPDMEPAELQEMLNAALNAAHSIRDVVAKIQELRKPTYRPYLDNREIINIHDEPADS